MIEAGKGDGTGNVYDDKSSLGMYMLFHFGSVKDTLFPFAENAGAPLGALRFPQRCSEFVIEAARVAGAQTQSALDLGCAVGGSSFHLATQGFASVAGVDISEGMIRQAIAVKSALSSGDEVYYSVPVETHTHRTAKADLSSYREVTDRVDFFVGDACDLPSEVNSRSFDAVLGANLVCRTPDPVKCLSEMIKVLKPGGVLCLTTPFTFMEEFTPRENWLGQPGEYCFDALQRELEAAGFELILKRPMPFLIRETGRKFQFTVSQGSAWKRRVQIKGKL